MIAMALPISETLRRNEPHAPNVIHVDFPHPPEEVVSAPFDLALHEFLANGNARYVKKWVEDNQEEIPAKQGVRFLERLSRYPDEFFALLSDRKLREFPLSTLIAEFLYYEED